MEDNNIEKSLVEQIFDETFEQLEADPTFTGEVIEDLRKLGRSGNLKKAKKVEDALKFKHQVGYETG